MSRTIVLLCLSLLLAWSHVGQAGEAGVRLDAGSIESEHTGWTYPLSVYLPASYAESSKSYPVLMRWMPKSVLT